MPNNECPIISVDSLLRSKSLAHLAFEISIYWFILTYILSANAVPPGLEHL